MTCSDLEGHAHPSLQLRPLDRERLVHLVFLLGLVPLSYRALPSVASIALSPLATATEWWRWRQEFGVSPLASRGDNLAMGDLSDEEPPKRADTSCAESYTEARLEASMLKLRPAVVALALTIASAALLAQESQSRTEFEVVSIKRHTGSDGLISTRSSPDTTVMTNVTVMTVLRRISVIPARDFLGLPEWVNTERYDIVVKAPAGVGRDQQRQREMWRAMVDDRMKLVTHAEQRERAIFALVVASKDGKFGPQLKPSTLDCSAPQPPLATAPGQGSPGVEAYLQRCGIGLVGETFASGGATMEQLARILETTAGAAVEDRTGLTGLYAFSVTTPFGRAPGPAINPLAADDAPDVFINVQEQLGLKLQPEKRILPVLVIERPSEN